MFTLSSVSPPRLKDMRDIEIYVICHRLTGTDITGVEARKYRELESYVPQHPSKQEVSSLHVRNDLHIELW